jgi:pimeloyl-ACP methyl ester carboxylesterase
MDDTGARLTIRDIRARALRERAGVERRRHSAIPGSSMTNSPASLLLIHGAGSGPWVFDGWDPAFPGVHVVAIDLQRDLDVRRATMQDYAGAVVAVAEGVRPPVALCGWSMGGLVALQAARAIRPHSVIVLEPSPPAEIQGFHADVELREGTFDPEEAYGPFPAGQRARPESLLARMERKRGISIPAIPSRSRVVYGDGFRDARGHRIAAIYGSEAAYLPGLGHWDLVLEPAVRLVIAQFLGKCR